MAPKPTKTAVPLPGSKSKSKSKPTSAKPDAKPPRSSELISASDDSSTEDAPAKAKKSSKKAKEPVTIAVHRPKVNGGTKKSDEPTASKTAAKKVVKKVDTESSSEEECSEESAGKNTSESTESESEDEEMQDAKPAPKAAASSSSSSDSESESESEDESEDESSEPGREAAPPKPSQSHTVEFVPAQPFVPPKGFEAIRTPLDTSSKSVKMLENLDGKQIWHITAPAGVPISQLEEIALDKALAGGPLLKYKGTDYSLSAGEKNEEGMCEVLVPQKAKYKAVPTKISRTFHLKQILAIPKLPTTNPEPPATGPAEFESITKSSVKAPRPQVKGLKMRYFHSGFGDQDPGVLGMSESEDDEPMQVDILHKPEKRRRSDAAGADAPTKKLKKHRTPEEKKAREERKAKKEKKAKAAA